MILAVHQPQYLPWLGYFDKIARSDSFVFLDNVDYKGREYQNRNRIRTKKGWIWLTVPVVSKGLGRQKIRDIKIDNSFPWQRKHLNSIRSWYGNSEYFNEYFPAFKDLYARSWERLADLNLKIIYYMLEKLSIEKTLHLESSLDIRGTKTDRIIEICKKLNADTYLSGSGGRAYLEEDKIARAGLKLIYQDFVHPVYEQQFVSDKNDFIPYMSIADLLFNEGPHSREILSGGSR